MKLSLLKIILIMLKKNYFNLNSSMNYRKHINSSGYIFEALLSKKDATLTPKKIKNPIKLKNINT